MKPVILICISFIITACSSNRTTTMPVSTTLFLQAENSYTSGQYKTARDQYLKVIASNPEHVESYFRLGNIAMRMSDFKQAHYYYIKVLRIKPDHAKSHHNIALAHLMAAEKHMLNYIRVTKQSSSDVFKIMSAISSYMHPRTDQVRTENR